MHTKLGKHDQTNTKHARKRLAQFMSRWHSAYCDDGQQEMPT